MGHPSQTGCEESRPTAIDTLRTSGSIFPITATLTGKATFKYISSIDGSKLFESGNATFTATVIDTKVKGGAGDTFAIRVLDKTGAVLVDLGTTALGGGNVVAHLKEENPRSRRLDLYQTSRRELDYPRLRTKTAGDGMRHQKPAGPTLVAGLAVLILIAGACSPAATVSTAPSPGASTAGTASASVEPTADLLKDARLQGVYVALRSVTSLSEFAGQYKVGQVQNRVYTATPTCPTGACDSSVEVTTPRQPTKSTFLFAWKAGTYVLDQTDAQSGWICGQGGKDYPVKESVEHSELHPVETQTINGVSVATRLSTTKRFEVHQTDAGTAAGCATWTVDMSGTLERTDDASAVIAGVSTSGGPRPASDITPDKSCSREKTARATYSKAMVTFTLENDTISLLTLFWLDAKGKRQKANDFGATAIGTQGSTKTQPWVVADNTGRCLLLFNGAAKTFTVR